MTTGPRARAGRVWQCVRDVGEDVAIEVVARRGRALLVMSGVALALGALVASLGISATASRQVAADMAASTLDEVSVGVAPAAATDQDADPPGAADGGATGAAPDRSFPVDAEARALAVDMVRSAGLVLDLTTTSAVEVTRLDPATTTPVTTVGLLAATSGYVHATGAAVRGATTALLDRSDPVAFVGVDAAGELGLPVTADPTGLQVWVGGSRVPVAGYLDGAGEVRSAVVLPYAVGLADVRSDRHATLLVRTEPGAGAPVARVIRTAISPDRPERLTTSPVVSLDSLRRGVATQLGRLVGTVGGLLLALSALLIAHSMVVSVVARTPEIGLRRALGASRARVSAVIWAEGALTGLLGGAAGAALASATTVAVAAANRWTPALDVPWVLACPLLGAGVGVLACLQPALRAARISPAAAVRAH